MKEIAHFQAVLLLLFLSHSQNLLIIISGTLALQVMQFASISFTATRLYATLPYMNPQVFLCTILQTHIVLLKVECLQEDQRPFLRYGFAQPPIIKEFSANFSSIFQQFSMLFPCLVYGSNLNLTRDLYKKKNWVELLQGMYFTFVLISLMHKPKIWSGGLNIWWSHHKYKTMIPSLLTLILRFLVEIICFHHKSEFYFQKWLYICWVFIFKQVT